jgi:hypothetical protein
MGHWYGFVNVGGRKIAQWQIVTFTLLGYYTLFKFIGYRGSKKAPIAPAYDQEERAFIQEYIKGVHEEVFI